jgi:hypothetical protein
MDGEGAEAGERASLKTSLTRKREEWKSQWKRCGTTGVGEWMSLTASATAIANRNWRRGYMDVSASVQHMISDKPFGGCDNRRGGVQ